MFALSDFFSATVINVNTILKTTIHCILTSVHNDYDTKNVKEILGLVQFDFLSTYKHLIKKLLLNKYK